jgi:glycosyltransferase involved in cell wall biosynthesis
MISTSTDLDVIEARGATEAPRPAAGLPPPLAQEGQAGRPKVTVMIITFNHARYIAQAIDSVLAQETDFSVAIHVIDDCSTDGAQDIIRDYAARYPGVIKPFINKTNIGGKVTQKNFYRGFRTLDGDYIAILEGDDFWTSPQRLQTHVAYLEANPDFVGCANNTLKVFDDGSSRPPELFQPAPPKDVHDIEDLIMIYSMFHASSLTFRNVFRGRVPRYLRSPLSCDIFLTIAHAQFGKIRFFPQAWSAYRVHAGGLFSQMSQTTGWMWNIDSFRACNRWLGYRYFPTFAKSIWNYCDILLQRGVVEDGFTPDKRRAYDAVRKRYRWLDRTYLKLDIALARWIPGYRARSAPAKLNMGCGFNRPLRNINVDVRRDVDATMVVDLEKTPWPWPDNYAGEVHFDRALEHMGADFKTFQAMMRELYRVCRPDARILINAKHPWTNVFIHDPTCVRVVSPVVLAVFDRQSSTYEDLDLVAERKKVDFEVVERSQILAEPYKTQFDAGQLSEDDAGRLLESCLNICSHFEIELRVHKPSRDAPIL